VIDAFTDNEGVKIWRDFAWILDPDDNGIMTADDGKNITFLRLLATKK
jgi:hypothetical protein